MEVTDSMKNANGAGTVYKRKEKTRKPYVVRVTEGWKEEDGRFVQKRRVLGCYRTQAEARQALADYHANPLVFQQDATFSEVYEKWSAKKYQDLSASAVRAYKAAFNHSVKLHSMKMRDVQAVALQNVLDTGGHSYDTKRFMAQLWRQMFTFAIANQLIQTGLNPADYLDLGKKEEQKKPHQRFTKEEIAILFEHADVPAVQVVLVLIYTGMRPGELVDLLKEDVHLDERWVQITHGKTKNAVRPVPLHPVIVPFVERMMEEPGDHLVSRAGGGHYDLDHHRGAFMNEIWQTALLKADVLDYDGGQHRPHDCRHTFTSLWKGQKLDEAIRRKIQGHSGQGIGEQIYMLPDLDDLKAEIDQLWTPDLLATCWLPCGT